MSNAYTIGADAGGVLPESQWPAADKAMMEAKALAAKLRQTVEGKWFIPGLGLDKEHYLNLLANFDNEVKKLGEMLNRLKHGPPFTTLSNPIQDWKERFEDLPRWAKSIDSSASFGSLTGAVKDVSINTAKDVGRAVANTGKAIADAGKNTLRVIRWAPWALGALGLLFVWDKIGRPGKGGGRA